MTGFDKIFEKSNMSEEKKKSKKLFGRLLIKLRNSNYIKLYALLEAVADTDMSGNEIKLMFNDKASYEMINNQKDIELLNSLFQEFEADIKVKLDCSGVNAFDEFKFEQFLKNEFGKLLTITESNNK